MLQLICSLETNLRNFVRSLRQAPRHDPRLPFSLTMLDQQPRSSKGTRPAISVSGYTRNISETGIALLVPAISKGDHHLAARNRRLLIVLELPTGTIRVQAAPVRYERLGKRAEQAGYLIGVRIISMSDDDRVRLLRYLHRLSRGARLSSKRPTSTT